MATKSIEFPTFLEFPTVSCGVNDHEFEFPYQWVIDTVGTAKVSPAKPGPVVTTPDPFSFIESSDQKSTTLVML